MADDDVPICKLVLVGDSGVGKTCLFQRFIEKKFTENSMPTLGVDYKIKSMQIEGRMLKLMVWDTAGQEKFSSMQKNFYQASDGMILVFSLTDRASFDHIDRWLERIYNEAPRDLPIMLIDDAEHRQVDFDMITTKAKTLKLPYIEASAKDGTNTHEAFNEMGRRILKRRNELGSSRVGTKLLSDKDTKGSDSQGGGGCSC